VSLGASQRQCAVLIHVTDEPVIKKLGILREGNGAQ
jgi:hypothetical protein